MKKHIFLHSLILFIFMLTGCGDNVRLRGTVTFSDDGSPLPMGTVNFAKDGYLARGIIKEDGSYVVGSLSSNDGLLPGTYRVYVTGAYREVAPGLDESLIDHKYHTPDTSGLVCEVPYPRGRYNISVDRFPFPTSR